MDTKINSVITVNVRFVPFGNVMIQLGSPSVQEPKSAEATEESKKPIYYAEPIETASLVYDLLYEGHNGGYIVPDVTGGV